MTKRPVSALLGESWIFESMQIGLPTMRCSAPTIALWLQSALPAGRVAGSLGIMRAFHLVRLLALLIALALIPACRTTPLNKQEAADWYARYASMVRWVGYQGSNRQHHHFIARVMDDWKFIQIRKDELTVDDERPYSTASSAPLYHYLVDPSRDYRKVER